MNYIFFLRTDNIMLKLCNQPTFITLSACLQNILLPGSIRSRLLCFVRWNLLFINKISLLKTLYIRKDPLTLGVDHLIFDRSGGWGILSFGLGKDFFSEKKIQQDIHNTRPRDFFCDMATTLRMQTAPQWQPFIAVSPLMVAQQPNFFRI